MLKKISKNKYQLIELLIIFIITLFYNLICMNFSGDEIWNYGFSYNISTGLIPYKDFNMIITPLFPLIGALFLSLFGKNFLVFHIFNALICTILFKYIKKIYNKNYYITYIIILTQSYPSYNLFCMLLLFIIITLEDNKANDYLIGIFLGITFITKQSIGIYLCFATLFTKKVKKISKRIIGFLIPTLLLIIYLLLVDCLKEFIDYTFLGMSSFVKENNGVNIRVIIVQLLLTIYLIYKYIKTKDIKVIYIILFQLLAYPMFDKYHVIISLIPAIGYILNQINIKSYISYIIMITFITTIFALNIAQIFTNAKFPNDTNEFKYKKISYKINDYIINYSKFIKEIPNDVELYIISANAYLFKLETSIKINKYDLLNDGNLGKNGEQGIINEIENNCNYNKCIFIIDLESQDNIQSIKYAKNINNFIKDKYTPGKIEGSYRIYKNY